MSSELEKILITHGATYSLTYLRAAYKVARQYAVQHFGRGKQLGRLTSKAFPLPWDWNAIPWPEIAAWMIAGRKDGLAYRTWNLYKYALIAMAPDNTEMRTLLLAAEHSRKPRYPRATASQRQKHLHPEELQQLRAAIEARRDTSYEYVWGDVLVMWLQAGISTGLRPSEWAECQLLESDAGPFLRVTNAKRDGVIKRFPNRYIPLTRDLAIGHLPEKELFAVQAFTRFMGEATKDGQSTFIYQGCRMLLHYLAHQIWPRRHRFPTIYSARHQFASNMKAQGKSQAEIAILLGHSYRSSQGAYGTIAAGSTEVELPVADKASIDQMAEQFEDDESSKGA